MAAKTSSRIADKASSVKLVTVPWPTISAAMAKAKSRIAVTAYLGTNGDDLLHLKPGDALYVNASDQTVKAGQTDPSVLMRLLKVGVRCFSVDRLHAKVYIADETVFLGSNNASQNSRDVLSEISVRIANPAFAASVHAWIGSLQAVQLDIEAVTALKKIYKSPKFLERKPRGKKKQSNTNTLWITYVRGEADEPDTEAYRAWVAEADDNIEDTERFEQRQIFSVGKKTSTLFRGVKPGDEVVAIDHDPGKAMRVSGPMRVLSKIHTDRSGGRVCRVLALEKDNLRGAVLFKTFRKYLLDTDVASLTETGRVQRKIDSLAKATVIRQYLTDKTARTND